MRNTHIHKGGPSLTKLNNMPIIYLFIMMTLEREREVKFENLGGVFWFLTD